MAKSLGATLKKVPESSTVPDGGYLLDIHKVEPATTGTGKKSFKAQLKVVEPKKYKGSMLFENFTIGSDEDPDADEQDTWDTSMGAKQFKQMVEKAGVELGDQDEDDLCAELKGNQVYAVVVEVTQTEGQYKGSVQNRVARNGWYAAGEKEPYTEKGGGEAKAKVKSKPAPKIEEEDEDDEPAPKKAAAKVKPKPKAVEDDDEGEEDEPPKAKAKTKPAKDADEDEDDDDGDDEEEEEEEEAPKKRRAK